MSQTSTHKHCPTCAKTRKHISYIRPMRPASYDTPAAPRIPSRPASLTVTYCAVCSHTDYSPAA